MDGDTTDAGTLARLERWLQGQIVGPHESRAKDSSKRGAVEAHIRPSHSLQPGERVSVYSDMYFSRLLDVLADEYSATRALCGPVEFERMVRAYLRKHPSRHWSLNELGRKLPEFLAGPFRIARKALLADVARLECSIAVVFDAPRSPVLRSADMAGIAADRFAGARVRLIDALELHEFDHAANVIVRALRQEEELPELKRSRSRTVVWRKEWVVWRMDLDEPMYRMLASLKAGERVQEAIAAGAARFEGRAEELQERISGAFAEWIGEGLISAIEVG